jgi:O-antigen ligase/polysaccharide polymerase Wzy-like membrane protein
MSEHVRATARDRMSMDPAGFVAPIGTLAVPVLLALLVAPFVVVAPRMTLEVVAAVVVVGALLLRVEWAALVFVAVEPFEDYAKSISGSAVKILGALLFLAWLIRLPARPRSDSLRHPVVIGAFSLLGVLLASTVLHSNGSLGTEVALRYVSYLGALIVLAQRMRDTLPARRVAVTYVAAITVAAVVGIVAYFGGELRAGGPISDPNDFAFFLVGSLPLLAVLRSGSRWRLGYDAAGIAVLLALLLTYSRGGLAAVAAMVLYALITGRIRLRIVATVAVVAAIVGIGIYAVHPSTIDTSLHAKGQVAQQNVDERLKRWQVAAEMAADNPVFGLGPAGFRENYDRYVQHRVTDPNHPLDVSHDTYLEVAAELGLAGLAAFLAVLGFGFAGARRRALSARGSDDPDARLAEAVCIAFVGTVVAAFFLTEQYYLPLWLLAAFGAALDPIRRDAR